MGIFWIEPRPFDERHENKNCPTQNVTVSSQQKLWSCLCRRPCSSFLRRLLIFSTLRVTVQALSNRSPVLGDKLLEIWVVCPQQRDCGSKRVKVQIWDIILILRWYANISATVASTSTGFTHLLQASIHPASQRRRCIYRLKERSRTCPLSPGP